MDLVFALVTYLGIQKIDISYFRNIDTCIHFAERINKNVGVPAVETTRRYKAVCQPQKVNLNTTEVY